MRDRILNPETHAYLGIEAGGTRTTACTLDDQEAIGPIHAFGPANLKLLDDDALRKALQAVARVFPAPRAVGIGMAGTRTDADRARLRSAAASTWPGAALAISHDLDVALAAAGPQPNHPRVLVLSGTGSCCHGRDALGNTARAGGWGHLLGDQGSGYDIALRALRQSIQQHDVSNRWSRLGQAILSHLQLDPPDRLVAWAHTADKATIAALAPVVFRLADQGDATARDIVRQAAQDLAQAAIACARQLAPRRAAPVSFVLAGGVLLGQPGFARYVGRLIRAARPAAILERLETPGAAGAARMARDAWRLRATTPQPPTPNPLQTPDPTPPAPPSPVPTPTATPPTEERHPRSRHLDRMPIGDAIDLMLDEDARIPEAIRSEKPRIARAITRIHRALASGGRLFYVGAGTSGRLGILDASECPPTFRTPPEWVQGIIAGGTEAVFRAVEGAEDDLDAGGRSIDERAVSRLDVVVGIAASGRTPFVWGALARARKRGATTVLLCFNPHLRFAPGQRPDVVIAPGIGPEILTGSTRLKAGTATKLILNLFTTLSMVRLGKVVSNLMVDLNPANAKLRDRAVRITVELTGAEPEAARRLLEEHGWAVKPAVAAWNRGQRRPHARRREQRRAGRPSERPKRPRPQRQT